LFGGDGRDILDGGAGRDLLRGEGGRDLFHAVDGSSDRILGGVPGEGDRAWADRRDIYADVKLMLA
ncbi:MAG: hypothetical protein JWM57_2788, partial [Phycisphaerales bacterium]|nr:hypothetical protein [Phycisphaerales bacterium]